MLCELGDGHSCCRLVAEEWLFSTLNVEQNHGARYAIKLDKKAESEKKEKEAAGKRKRKKGRKRRLEFSKKKKKGRKKKKAFRLGLKLPFFFGCVQRNIKVADEEREKRLREI